MNINKTIKALDEWLKDNVCDSSWEVHKQMRDYLAYLKRMGFKDVVFKNSPFESLIYQGKLKWL